MNPDDIEDLITGFYNHHEMLGAFQAMCQRLKDDIKPEDRKEFEALQRSFAEIINKSKYGKGRQKLIKYVSKTYHKT